MVPIRYLVLRMTDVRWYRFSVNPEPWAVGPLGVGRRGGRLYPYMGRNEQLYAFQEAVREEFGEPDLMEGHLKLTFYFWRELQPYRTEKTRLARKHEADATNMQKALEDALQGYLYGNDRDNRDIRSIIMAQPAKSSGIIVKAELFSTDAFFEVAGITDWRNG